MSQRNPLDPRPKPEATDTSVSVSARYETDHTSVSHTETDKTLESTEPAAPAKDQFEIPYLIHVIWAGGTINMPDKNIEVVNKWSKQHPEFTICLWVDYSTYQNVFELKDYYKEKFKPFKMAVFDKKPSGDSKSCVLLKDISEEKLIDEYVMYEIRKLKPNYGASSDILRYRILHKYGGVYIDTDIEPGRSRLDHYIRALKDQHVLFVDHCSQRQDADIKTELSQFDLRTVGNDTFICTTHNPLMLDIMNRVLKKYNPLASKLRTNCYIAAHTGRNIEKYTIDLTGPRTIMQALHGALSPTEDKSAPYMQYRLQFVGATKSPVKIFRVRTPELQLTKPKERNDRSWIGIPIQSVSYQIGLEKIKMAIDFERQHFNIMRLDEHIDDLLEATRAPNGTEIDKNRIMIDLRSWLEEIQTREKPPALVYVHITGKYPATLSMCQSFKWKTMFDMPPHKWQLLLHLLNLSTFANEFKNPKGQENVSTIIAMLHGSSETMQSHKLRQLMQGTDYLAALIANVNQFKHPFIRQQVAGYLENRIHKYILYAEALQNVTFKQPSTPYLELSGKNCLAKLITLKSELHKLKLEDKKGIPIRKRSYSTTSYFQKQNPPSPPYFTDAPSQTTTNQKAFSKPLFASVADSAKADKKPFRGRRNSH